MTQQAISSPAPSTRTKLGLVLAALNLVSNVPSAFVPVNESGETGPPLGILVLCTVLAIVGLVAAGFAWRGSAAGMRAVAATMVVIMLTSLPAFFVDVPLWVKVAVAVNLLWVVLAIVLMFGSSRTAQFTGPVVESSSGS